MALAVSKFRVLTTTGAVALLALACTGCSTASPAAQVNGQVVSQDALDQQLTWLASSSAYVKDFNQSQQEAAEQQIEEREQQGESTAGIVAETVAGDSTGQDNFSDSWVVGELNRMIYASAISQYLAQEHKEPTAEQYAAAFASEDAVQPAAWRSIPPQMRNILAEEDAQHALIEPAVTSSALSSDKQFYSQYKDFFWSKVCVTEVDVPAGPGAKAEAAKDASALETGGASAPTGASYCLTPEQLIEHSTSFFSAVGALPIGKAIAFSGAGGYQVVLARSRNTVPLDAATVPVVNVVVSLRGSQGNGTGDTALIKVMKKFKVSVNAKYGVWIGSPPSPYPPQEYPYQLLFQQQGPTASSS